MKQTVTITLLDNGYLLEMGSLAEAHLETEDLFARLLKRLEGRSAYGSGDDYGEVVIYRSKPEATREH